MIVQMKLGTSNAYLVRGQNGAKSMLIDTGSPGELNKILKILRKENVDIRKEISLIIHTHAHPDHAGNSWKLKQLSPETQILIHSKEAEFLEKGYYKPVKPTRLTARLLTHFLKKEFKGVKPDIIIENEVMQLDRFGIKGTLVFTPGHTEGPISVIVPNGEEGDVDNANNNNVQAVAGDLMKGGHLGGVISPNQPDYHYFAYDLYRVRSSIKKLMDLHVSKVYLGHGGPLNANDVKDKFLKDFNF
jgi:hydroxyacylglutathione hydrolase